MIVPMKKVFVIARQKDDARVVDGLGELGIVHVQHSQVPPVTPLVILKEEIEMARQALSILGKESPTAVPGEISDGIKIAQEIVNLNNQTKLLQESIRARQFDIEQWSPWGDFDPRDFKQLQDTGIMAGLCELPFKERKNLPSDMVIKVIQSSQKIDRCLLISSTPLHAVKFLDLPSVSLSQMKARQDTDQIQLQLLKSKINDFKKQIHSLKKCFEQKQEEFNFTRAVAGMKQDSGIVLLTGFCPQDLIKQLDPFARETRSVVIFEDPADEDQVPTCLRNPPWIEMIKPVFEFLNFIPGYRELDVSFFFLTFLSIFFGILIGDAGYGILFIILTVLAHKKIGSRMTDQSIFFLIYSMSTLAIIWGFLTGTFFGTLLLGSLIKPICPWLTVNENVQLFCFIIGAVHLSIAHIWRILNRLNSLTAFAEIGWLMIVWACFFVTRFLIIDLPLPKFINILFILGPSLVILFNQPRKNFAAQLGLGLGDFLLNVMGFFGDIVSYIRLFAVGLAGVSVADAFNQMAMTFGFKNFGFGVMTILILLVGHTLNMTLACFGVLVHGIRLNLMEFSMHLGVELSGMAYDPLKRQKIMRGV